MEISNDYESPLVSIIIPTYNRAKFLEQAIDSALKQTYKNIEIIIVDDGSTDDTKKIVNKYVDTRIKYFYQSNKGRSNARNYAISLANGYCITFLDSDDLYFPNKVELQVYYLLNHPGTGMVYTSAYCIDGEGAMLKHKYEASESGFIYNSIAYFTPLTITLPTVMTYKHVLDHVGGFDEQLHRFEDTDMWRRIARQFRIDAIPEYTCLLRTHDDNTLVNQDAQAIVSALDIYSEKIFQEDSFVELSVRKAGVANLYFYYGQALMSVPKFAGFGRKLLKKSNKLKLSSMYPSGYSSISSYILAYIMRMSGTEYVLVRIKNLMRSIYYRSINCIYKTIKDRR